jgi:hypothetical protein
MSSHHVVNQGQEALCAILCRHPKASSVLCNHGFIAISPLPQTGALGWVHAKLMANLEEGKKVARPSLDVDSLSCIGNLSHLILQSRNLPDAVSSITLARTFGTIISIA